MLATEAPALQHRLEGRVGGAQLHAFDAFRPGDLAVLGRERARRPPPGDDVDAVGMRQVCSFLWNGEPRSFIACSSVGTVPGMMMAENSCALPTA